MIIQNFNKSNSNCFNIILKENFYLKTAKVLPRASTCRIWPFPISLDSSNKNRYRNINIFNQYKKLLTTRK